MGALNVSVSLLVSIMIMNDAFGWSDLQLFEHCRFDLLTCNSLGLYNLSDEMSTDLIYYLFTKWVNQ